MTSGALSFVMYTYRNNLLGGMVTDIQGHPGHNAFVTACGHLANIQLGASQLLDKINNRILPLCNTIQSRQLILLSAITADSQSPYKMVNVLLEYIDSFIIYLNIMLVTSYIAVMVVEVIVINTLAYSNNTEITEASNHSFLLNVWVHVNNTCKMEFHTFFSLGNK